MLESELPGCDASVVSSVVSFLNPDYFRISFTVLFYINYNIINISCKN